MKPLPRRILLKAAAGLVAFVPVVRELAQSSPAAAECESSGPPPVYGPTPPDYQLCDEVRIWVAEEMCLQNEDGSWTIYRDQTLLDAFCDVDGSGSWYLFSTG
jgi:hypothetical protein